MTLGTMIGIFCICIIVVLLNGRWRDHDTARLARLERKVNQIAERSGIEQSPLDQQMQELIVQGRKINAIKLYRERTGVGLKEAKEAVDSLEAQMKTQGLV